MALIDEKTVREETRRLRDKGKSLSGFWVAEIAAAIYALEWALGKREKAPTEDIGEPDSGHGKLAESISKAAEKAPPAAKPAAKFAAESAAKPVPKPAAKTKTRTSSKRR